MTSQDDAVRARACRLIDAADYRGHEDALSDVTRVAALASNKEMRRVREARRRDAVYKANLFRGESSKPIRVRRKFYQAAIISSMALALLGISLIGISPRDGKPVMTLAEGAPLAGILTLVAVTAMGILEPHRASGAIWGRDAPPRIHGIIGVMLSVFAVGNTLSRWSTVYSVDKGTVALGISGVLIAGLAGIVLWVRACRADVTTTTSLGWGVMDPDDVPAVVSALDEWWAGAGQYEALKDEKQLRAARVIVLDELAQRGVIEAARVREAADAPLGPWRERHA